MPKLRSLRSISDIPPSNLPFSLLSVQESLQDSNQILQCSQPHSQGSLDLGIVISELNIEIFSVWAGGHGGAEYGLYHEGVVGFESFAVGAAEGNGEFVGGGCKVL